MKTRIKAVILGLICMAMTMVIAKSEPVDADPFSRSYKTVEETIDYLKHLSLNTKEGYIKYLFSAQEAPGLVTSDSNMGVVCFSHCIDEIHCLWQGKTKAIVYAEAQPAIHGTKCAKAVLLVLEKDESQWRIADAQSYVAYGKYAGFSCKLTAESDTSKIDDESEVVITLSKGSGGRGLSLSTSISLKFDDDRLVPTF